MSRGKYKRKRERQHQRQIAVRDLGMSTRLTNLLEKAGIMTLADLTILSDSALLSIHGIGPTMISEIHKKINSVTLNSS